VLTRTSSAYEVVLADRHPCLEVAA
jgi:hypothetical protein